jgi:putative NADH-flavin reductase
LAGHDAAVGSVRFPTSDPANLIGAASDSKVGRYLVVGRTGSLDLTRPRRRRARPFWNPVVPQKQLNWTFLSPVGAFCGGRTNRKVPAGNGPAFDRGQRQKPAFYEDFAVAQAGEMEPTSGSDPRLVIKPAGRSRRGCSACRCDIPG